MFKRKKKKTGYQPPEYRKPTPPPPPTSGSNAVKPNPNYVPPSSVKTACVYETPCGWCTKWNKKCDRQVGYSPEPNIKAFGKHTRAELVAMEGLLDKYHKFYDQEKFTEELSL